MRILKRNLAFVLAMVMALSLTVSAMGIEDYSDKNDIAFAEAVDVLTEMGVLEGTDGVFNPTNTLTREEGAKIIAYLMLGKSAADNLNVAKAPFEDVPANRWSAGYVAYCASQGIVKGVSATEFNPKGELTGTAFATMLLRACGYGVNGEFEGFGWESEVNALALKLGVFDGNLGVNFSAACTREEAALYAFNTLMDVYTVKYSELFGTYYAGSTVLDQETKNFTTLNDELYDFDTKDSEDAFGREGYVYINAKNKTVTGVYGVEADLTYTTEVDLVDIYADLGLEDEVNATYIQNGKTGAAKVLNDAEDNDASIGGNGILVEVYAEDVEQDNGDYVTEVKIVEIRTYLAEVDAYDVDDEEVEVTVLSESSNINTTFETAVEYEEDDLVLITAAYNKTTKQYDIKSMELAETVEGKVTAKRAGKFVKLDGEQYNYAAKAVVENLNNAAFEEGELVIDNYGYAMYFVGAEEDKTVADGYVKVGNVKVSTDDFEETTTAKIKVTFFADGTEATHNLAIEKKEVNDEHSGKEYVFKMIGTDGLADYVDMTDMKTSDLAEKLNADVYGYVLNDNDEIILVELAATDYEYYAETTVEFDGTRAGLVGEDEYRLNTTTVATVVVDEDVDTLEGYKNIKIEAEADEMVEVLLILNGSIIKEAYINGEADATAEEAVIVYFDGTSLDAMDDDMNVIWLYNNDTDSVDYTISDEVLGQNGKGIYTVDINTDGEIESMTLVEVVQVADVDDDAAFFVVGETEHHYAEDAKLWDVTGSTVKTADTDDVAANDYVAFIADEDDDAVTVLYIVPAALYVAE